MSWSKDREALEARFAEARFAAAEAAEGVAQMQAEVRELNLLLSKAERDKEGAHKERNSARATLAGVEAMLRGEGGKSAPASQSASPYVSMYGHAYVTHVSSVEAVGIFEATNKCCI